MKKIYLTTLIIILALGASIPAKAGTPGDSLSIGSNNKLTVGTGCMLTVSGDLINRGNITLSSDATGNASLIIGGSVSGSGTFIRQQYIVNDDGWHMIASPSQQDTIVGSDFVPSPTGGVLPTNFDFYSFDQSQTNSWINIRASDKSVNSSFEKDFVPGKGYLVAYASGYGKTTLDFKGPFNSGDIAAPALAYTTGAAWAGWNLIGNPYTSAIDWGEADHSAFTDNFAYVYDPNKAGGAGYIDVDGSTTGAYLAPGQAFFVNVSASGSFTFKPDMQLHQTATTLKSSEAQQSNSRIVLQLSSGNQYDETTIRLIYGTKSARDRDDALELPSLDNSVPQLYSYTSDSVKVAINTFPEFDSIHAVQLGTIIPKDGSYTISLQSMTGAFATKHAFLEDLDNGTRTNLNTGNYTFKGHTADHKRFILVFDGTTGIPETNANKSILVYGYHNSIYIRSKGGSLLNGKASIINLMGATVYKATLNGATQQVLHPQLSMGMYLVKLQMKDGSVIVKKVVLER